MAARAVLQRHLELMLERTSELLECSGQLIVWETAPSGILQVHLESRNLVHKPSHEHNGIQIIEELSSSTLVVSVGIIAVTKFRRALVLPTGQVTSLSQRALPF